LLWASPLSGICSHATGKSIHLSKTLTLVQWSQF